MTETATVTEIRELARMPNGKNSSESCVGSNVEWEKLGPGSPGRHHNLGLPSCDRGKNIAAKAAWAQMPNGKNYQARSACWARMPNGKNRRIREDRDPPKNLVKTCL